MCSKTEYAKKIKQELVRNFESHPSVVSEDPEGPVPYSLVFGLLTNDFSSDFSLNMGTAIALLALSYEKHFSRGIPEKTLELLKGDYFYARALKYTIQSNRIEAVNILSRAVITEIRARSLFKPSCHLSLIKAALELDRLRRNLPYAVKIKEDEITRLQRILDDESLEKHFDRSKLIEELISISGDDV